MPSSRPPRSPSQADAQTRHGKEIAILSPADSPVERYAHLVAQGKIKLKPVTAAERHSMPHYEVPESVDPVALLPAERAEDDR